MKRLRWDPPGEQSTLPKRPYRDTAIVYALLAALIVLIAVLTGGNMVRALITAAAVFVVATLWSWRTWRNRMRDERSERRDKLL